MDKKRSSSSQKDFKRDYEKNLNHELEANSDDPVIQEHHDAGAYYPPPTHDEPAPPPFVSFSVPPLPRKSGVYIPLPIAIIFLLVFLLETSVIVFYTAVALYRVLPAAGFSIGLSNHCQSAEHYGAINVSPNIYVQPQPSNVLSATVMSFTSTTAGSTTSTSTAGPTTTHVTTLPPVPPSVITSTVLETAFATPTRSTVTTIQLVTVQPT